jgi:hypothetical protein
MKQAKKSGSAILIDCINWVTFLVAIGCFVLYYGGIVRSGVVLWVGVTSFTILYHLGLRIFMGTVTSRWRLRYSHPWFRERSFEKKLYKLLRVRRWKEKVLTYDPAAFSVQNHTLEEIATTMTKSETDHWINQLISLSTLLFAIPWGVFWIFFTTAILSMLFDAQFIIVQRYNRPIVLRLMERGIQRV